MNTMNKKCNSCGRFPFCKTTKGPTDTCNNHIKREVKMKFIYKDGKNFEFERIDK